MARTLMLIGALLLGACRTAPDDDDVVADDDLAGDDDDATRDNGPWPDGV